MGVERGSGVKWGVKVRKGGEVREWKSGGVRERGGVGGGGGAGAIYRTSIGSHAGRGMKNGTRSHVHRPSGGGRGDGEWEHAPRGE